MRIAVTYENGNIFQHFGHTEQFKIYDIENGKIAYALTETMISGCVPEMLMNIREISKDTLMDGAASVPYVAFEGVTISGK